MAEQCYLRSCVNLQATQLTKFSCWICKLAAVDWYAASLQVFIWGPTRSPRPLPGGCPYEHLGEFSTKSVRRILIGVRIWMRTMRMGWDLVSMHWISIVTSFFHEKIMQMTKSVSSHSEEASHINCYLWESQGKVCQLPAFQMRLMTTYIVKKCPSNDVVQRRSTSSVFKQTQQVNSATSQTLVEYERDTVMDIEQHRTLPVDDWSSEFVRTFAQNFLWIVVLSTQYYFCLLWKCEK